MVLKFLLRFVDVLLSLRLSELAKYCLHIGLKLAKVANKFEKRFYGRRSLHG